MPKFADDTKVAKVVNDSKTAAEMQDIINKLETWCSDWGMTFNVKKCCIIHFGHRNAKYQYQMNGEVLESVCNQRDLGIQISDSCLPGNQCAQAAKKANQVLGQISRTFSCKTKDVMLQIYKIFVRPHLEYCIEVWNPSFQGDISSMEKVQNKMSRLMRNGRQKPPEERS